MPTTKLQNQLTRTAMPMADGRGPAEQINDVIGARAGSAGAVKKYRETLSESVAPYLPQTAHRNTKMFS